MATHKIMCQRIDARVILLVLFGLAASLHAEEIPLLRLNQSMATTKTLSFPANQIMGKLFLEPESGSGFDPVRLTLPYAWESEYFGVAQDAVLVPEARNVQLLIRLGLSAQESATLFEQNPRKHQVLVASRVRKDPQDLSGLLQLDPNDLFRLSVDSAMSQRKGVDQRVFEPIRHLTGLQMLSLTSTGVTDKGLEYLRPLRSLRVLVLTESSVGHRGLAVLMDLPALEYLDLSTGVTDIGLKQVGQHPNLRWLRMTPEKIWGPGLGHLANLPRLERLCIWGGNISDRHIKYMEGLTQLKSLTLWGGCDRLTDASLASIGKLKNLEELHFIRTSPRFTPAGVLRLRNLKNLKKIDFAQTWAEPRGPQGGDRVIRHLAALPNLESIRGINALSAEGMQTLTTFRHLKCLHIMGMGFRDRKQGGHGPTGLSHLASLRFLEELNINSDVPLSDADFVALESLDQLNVLRIRYRNLNDQGLASIGKLKQLESLALWGGGFTCTALNQLNGLSNLHTLRVAAGGKAAATSTVDELMLDLSGLKKMKDMHLSGLSLEDGDLAFLEDLPVLENLMIQSNSLSGAFMRSLRGLPKLDTLRVIGLSSCKGEDLANLNGLPKLSDIALEGNIPNSALAFLTDQPSLHSLNIRTNNPIQKQSVDILKQQHPLIEYIRVNELMKMPTRPASPPKRTGVSRTRTNRQRKRR